MYVSMYLCIYLSIYLSTYHHLFIYLFCELLHPSTVICCMNEHPAEWTGLSSQWSYLENTFPCPLTSDLFTKALKQKTPVIHRWPWRRGQRCFFFLLFVSFFLLCYYPIYCSFLSPFDLLLGPVHILPILSPFFFFISIDNFLSRPVMTIIYIFWILIIFWQLVSYSCLWLVRFANKYLEV